MSCSENAGDSSMLSKEHLDSSSADEVSYCGSSMGGGRVVLKKGPWTSAEDTLLISYVEKHGEGNWNNVQRHTGLLRCGKSCRLRWANHLRPHLKKGAFSPEEEQIIIQMHSKMGNRWAQMAALLPGRTDNEIKNYWNTRVKRRQRAGLPLYPAKFSLQISKENQPIQTINEFGNGSQEFRVHSQKVYSRPLSYAPPLSHSLASGMPNHGLGCYTRRFLNPDESNVKKTMESETSFPVCHLSLASLVPAYEQPQSMNSETTYFNPDFEGKIPSQLKNNSSSRPPLGSLKMELPSLQVPEAGYVDWNASSPFTSSYDAVDTYIQSPENVLAQSDCTSSRNNGLLEDLVQESQAISGKKQSYEKRCDHVIAMVGSSTAKWDEIRDPTSPFCPSAVSLFHGCNVTFDAHTSPTGATMLGAKQISVPNLPDFFRPDAILGSDFFRHDCVLGSGWFIGNSQRGDILSEERVTVPAGTSSMATMESYPWINMPRACQMTEH